MSAQLTCTSIGASQSRDIFCRCEHCGKKGATLGCRVSACPSSYHLPCAQPGACALYPTEYLLACPRHKAAFPSALPSLAARPPPSQWVSDHLHREHAHLAYNRMPDFAGIIGAGVGCMVLPDMEQPLTSTPAFLLSVIFMTDLENLPFTPAVSFYVLYLDTVHTSYPPMNCVCCTTMFPRCQVIIHDICSSIKKHKYTGCMQ